MTNTAKAPRMPYDANAVLSFEPKRNGRNFAEDKETVCQFIYICATPNYDANKWRGRFTQAVVARVYRSRSNRYADARIYASVWIHLPDHSDTASGHGYADGCDYHKPSAAIDAAFASAGVKFAAHFDGYGDEAIKHAMTAIAEHVGWRNGEVLEV